MTGYPRSPRLTRAGLVLIDPDSGAVDRIITLQYAAETLQRSLQAQTIADEPDRSQPLRLTGPAVETLTLDAMLDATDQLEQPKQFPDALETGIFPAGGLLATDMSKTTHHNPFGKRPLVLERQEGDSPTTKAQQSNPFSSLKSNFKVEEKPKRKLTYVEWCILLDDHIPF